MGTRPPKTRAKSGSVHRFAHEAMATAFEILIAGKPVRYARQAAAAAFSEIDRLERLFSRFDPSSEISRLGRLGPGETMRIGIETAEVLALAAAVQAETAGAFDVNVLAAPAPLGSLVRIRQVGGGFEATRLDPRRKAKATPPLDLDLGAVGKGYALDAAAAVLSDWGVTNALLHAGTSTALGLGPGPSGRGWPVGAGGPSGGQRIRLRDRALSGSGTEVKGEHIIDPRSGRPAPRSQAAWASHTSAAAADALSTAFAVMTDAEAASFCRRHPEVWAQVIRQGKRCRIYNPGALERESRRARRRQP